MLREGKRYASGFWKGSRLKGRLIPIPLRGSASAVIYAPTDAEEIRKTVMRLRALPLDQIVVALPRESPPELLAALRSQPGLTIVFRPDTADSAVGRALGAKLTTEDSVLFVDGVRPGKTETLARFLWLCDQGMDVALNDVSGQIGTFDQRSRFFHLTEFLNRTMGRRDLMANSFFNLPYALSRRALDRLGPDQLADPAGALTTAILSGLNVGMGGAVPPVTRGLLDDPDRWELTSKQYAEAWRKAMQDIGGRMLFPDTVRDRQKLEQWS